MYTIRAKIKFHSKDTAKQRYAGTYVIGAAENSIKPTWLKQGDNNIIYFGTIRDAEEWFHHYEDILVDEVEQVIVPEIVELAYIPVKLLAKRQNTLINRYNIGDRVRAKIHYENDPRTEVDATICGITVNQDKSVSYKVWFEPTEWDKQMGSTGCEGHISETDIIS